VSDYKLTLTLPKNLEFSIDDGSNTCTSPCAVYAYYYDTNTPENYIRLASPTKVSD